MEQSAIDNRAEQWARRLANTRAAMPALFLLSALETLFLPVAIELVLAPWMLMERRRVWALATVTLAGCMAGSLIGYGVGATVFDSVGQWVLATFAEPGAYEAVTERFNRNGFWAIVAVGILPIPFQAAILAAGVAHYPIPLFIAATLVARGLRYYGLAVLVMLLGASVITLWREHRIKASVATFAILAVLVWAMQAWPVG